MSAVRLALPFLFSEEIVRIAVLDDDRQETEALEEALRGWDPTRSAECFADGASPLAAAKVQPPFTVAFIDIYLPKENGVDIAKELVSLSPRTDVVFVTTSREHAVQAFEVGAVHYLVKPVTTGGIREAFSRIAAKWAKPRPILSVKVGKALLSEFLENIVGISSRDHAVEIELASGETFMVNCGSSELLPQLDERFLNVRRGYVVNMEYIESMGAESCTLRSGEAVLLSRKGRTSLRETYNRWVFSRLAERR